MATKKSKLNEYKHDFDDRDHHECGHHMHMHHGGSKAIYGLGFIGAAVYYISTANSFWMGVLGILKALVWPAFLVFGLLKSIGI